jgi:hypothetical protein
VDTANNIYIADLLNACVRKVDAATGLISTIAGVYPGGSYSGDGGPATAAMLYHPWGVCLSNGNIYIADALNYRVRRVDAAGIITTVAGIGTLGESGDGSPATAAQLYGTFRIVMDKALNLYVSEAGVAGKGNRVRKIDAITGIITTFAGNSLSTGTLSDTSGNGGPATDAPMEPYGMCFDTCGNLYVESGCVIRVITPTPYTEGSLCNSGPALRAGVGAGAGGMQAYPNPTTGALTIRIATMAAEQARIVITNALGQKVKELLTVTNKATDIELHAPPGIYFVTALTQQERWTQQVTVSP